MSLGAPICGGLFTLEEKKARLGWWTEEQEAQQPHWAVPPSTATHRWGITGGGEGCSPPLSADSMWRAGWSWLTASSRCPRCPQANARGASPGAGRPPSRSTLLRRSTSPRAETSTPHPAETQVGPKPRRGVPWRSCTPSRSAWKRRAPWWCRAPRERDGYFFHIRPWEKVQTLCPFPLFLYKCWSLPPPPPPPRFFLCQGFSRLFFLNFFVSSYNGNISQRATVAAVRNRFMSIMRKKLQFHTKNTCFKVVSALNV